MPCTESNEPQQPVILHPKIINLSSIKLTEVQKNVLSKRLKFTPTSVENKQELKADIENFTRRLRLIEFFSRDYEDENENDKSIVKNKSNFYPQCNRDKHLDHAVEYLNNLPLNSEKKKFKSNLTKIECKAIKDLKENDNVVIKEADKGGSVVIMSKEHYMRMVYNQLNDHDTYKRVNPGHDKKVMTFFKKFVAKYNGNLTDKETDYLMNFKFRKSNSYGLPKVHKSKMIEEQTKLQNKEYVTTLEPQDLKLSPIVAGPQCPAKPLSTLLDIIIKPLMTHVKSYSRDSLDFLNKCSRILYINSWLYGN